MIKVDSKILVALVMTFVLFDLLITYAVFVHWTSWGVPAGIIRSSEVNKLLTTFWRLSGSIIVGIIVEFGVLFGLSLFIFWIYPQSQRYPFADHSFVLGLGLGMITMSIYGIINNTSILINGTPLVISLFKFLTLVFILMFLGWFVSGFLDKKGKVWVKMEF